jgi:hypothetical protein
MSDEGCGCLAALVVLGAVAYGALNYLGPQHGQPASSASAYAPPVPTPTQSLSRSHQAADSGAAPKARSLCAVIRRAPVDSSAIRSIGYCPAERTLEVEFHRGAVYRYWGVSQRTYDAFMAAPSKGQFFNAAIRNEPYGYARVK